MKLCLSSLSPKCENSTMEKCIFKSSLKNTETQQGGLHGEASIGSTPRTSQSWISCKSQMCPANYEPAFSER